MADLIKLLKAIESSLKPKPPQQKQKLTPKQFAQMKKVKLSIHLFMLQLATLDRIKDESDKLVQEMVQSFIRQIPQKIKQAESGLPAAENETVEAAVEAGQKKRWKRDRHLGKRWKRDRHRERDWNR